MSQSIQDFHDDPRNASIHGFVLGDGVWEGLRVVGGHPVFLDAHLDRLYEGANALMLDIDGVHIRLMVARRQAHAVPGPARHHRAGDGGDHRRVERGQARDAAARPEALHRARAARLARRAGSEAPSHSKLNCITACIQATQAGADEALS